MINTRKPITNTYQWRHLRNNGTFSLSSLCIIFLFYPRPPEEYDHYPDNQPQQNAKPYAFDEYAQQQTHDDGKYECRFSSSYDWFLRCSHDNFSSDAGPANQNPFLLFNASRLASRRYAPGTPAGNCRKNTRPV